MRVLAHFLADCTLHWAVVRSNSALTPLIFFHHISSRSLKTPAVSKHAIGRGKTPRDDAAVFLKIAVNYLFSAKLARAG